MKDTYQAMFEQLFTMENMGKIDSLLSVFLLGLIVMGFLLLFIGLRRTFRGKFISGTVQGLSGFSCGLLAMLLFSIGINLTTYQRFTFEQDIAEIKFNQTGEQTYQARIFYNKDKLADVFMLRGDEWQLDARVIKWKSWATLLGLNTRYRLERISGRYLDIDDERNEPRSVYSLTEESPVDYWQFARHYQDYLPWIDASYGSATYLPMADDAHYIISISQTGLLARPIAANQQ